MGMTTDEFTRNHKLGTDPSALPAVVVGGVEYVPFSANEISRDLAARRKRQNEKTPGEWSAAACVPGIRVLYRRSDSLSVRAMGRL